MSIYTAKPDRFHSTDHRTASDAVEQIERAGSGLLICYVDQCRLPNPERCAYAWFAYEAGWWYALCDDQEPILTTRHDVLGA